MQSTCRRCGRSTALTELSTDSMGRPICKACKSGQKPSSAPVNAAAASQAALSMIAKSAAVTAQTPKRDLAVKPAASVPMTANVGRKAPVVSRPAGGMQPASSGLRPANGLQQAAGSSQRATMRPAPSVTNTPGPSTRMASPEESEKGGVYKCSKCGYSFKPTRSNPKVYAVCPFCKGPIVR